MTIMSHENLAHFYDEAYSEASATGDRHARWRKLSALGKADHAIQLCERAGFRPGSIAEIGCGDGAVLAELGARGLAGQLHGFEVSEEAAVIARGRGTPGLVGVSVYDGLRLPARDSEFDLAILSHVLEHVSDPVALLREAARVARAVVLEVPLEANLSASRPGKRKGAARIGHMQTLDRRAVRSLVEKAGMRVRDELLDPLPLEVHMFFAPAGAPRMRAIAKAVVRRGVFALSPQLAQRAFTLHYAALCA